MKCVGSWHNSLPLNTIRPLEFEWSFNRRIHPNPIPARLLSSTSELYTLIFHLIRLVTPKIRNSNANRLELLYENIVASVFSFSFFFWNFNFCGQQKFRTGSRADRWVNVYFPTRQKFRYLVNRIFYRIVAALAIYDFACWTVEWVIFLTTSVRWIEDWG